MKKTIFLTFAAVAVILTSNGCKKDDDTKLNYVATGTNNNTVQTSTFTITAAQWVADSAGLQWGYLYTIPSGSNISGAVLLYLQDGTNWAALPHVDYGWTYEFEYDPTAKIMNVQIADAKASTLIPNPGDKTFRMVTIPPGARKAHPNVNWKNYEEVKKAFNLSENNK